MCSFPLHTLQKLHKELSSKTIHSAYIYSSNKQPQHVDMSAAHFHFQPRWHAKHQQTPRDICLSVESRSTPRTNMKLIEPFHGLFSWHEHVTTFIQQKGATQLTAKYSTKGDTRQITSSSTVRLMGVWEWPSQKAEGVWLTGLRWLRLKRDMQDSQEGKWECGVSLRSKLTSLVIHSTISTRQTSTDSSWKLTKGSFVKMASEDSQPNMSLSLKWGLLQVGKCW